MRPAVPVLLALLAGACRPEPLKLPDPNQRRTSAGLGAGDTLEIRVFDEERFDGEYQVGEDGAIDFPMVGSLAVRGLDKDAVAHLIEEKLADGYLNSPHVTVQVKQRGNREVSVLGQVNKAGSLDFRDGLTIVQAVSEAGGLTDFAAPKRVKLTRRTGNGDETITFEVSLSAIIEGRAEDLVLRPGDIVFVPETWI
jgi:protein involved in polysaccharide export with SLBB domain